LPSIEELAQQYKDNGLKILLINLKEKDELVTSFVSRNNYSSTVLLDVDGKVAEKYSVFGIPVSYLIDKHGKVVTRSLGFVDWSSSKKISLVNNLIEE
jgi:thiol-disulfide isomerase/thioredoxin